MKILRDRNSNQPFTSSRLHSFDALKLFAIFLVLWGHCTQHLLSSDYADEPIYRYIYSFHMPLFMMISGYFASSSMNLDFRNLFKKKFIQLILPCIAWGIIIYLMMWILKGKTDNISTFFYRLVMNFWFLKSLFLCYMLAYTGKKILVNKYAWIILTLLLSQIFPPFNMPLMYPMFLIGMHLRRMATQWQNQVRKLLPISSILFFILLCFWDKSYWESSETGILSALKSQNWGLFSFIVYHKVYRIAIGITGSFTFIFLFYLLFRNDRQSKLLNTIYDWGKYTLGIYILQLIVLETFMARILNFDHCGFWIFNFVIAPLLSVLVLIACVSIVKFINKYPILSFWLLGKEDTNSKQ